MKQEAELNKKIRRKNKTKIDQKQVLNSFTLSELI